MKARFGHDLTNEAAQMEKAGQIIEAEQAAIEAIAEEYDEVFDEIPIENVNGSFIKSVRASIKQAKGSPYAPKEYVTIWKDFDSHAKAQEAQKELQKELIKKLSTAVQAQYAKLTEKDIRELVFEDKWMPSILGRITSLMETARQGIIKAISELNDRYDITLPEIENDIDMHRKLVQSYLKEMGISL